MKLKGLEELGQGAVWLGESGEALSAGKLVVQQGQAAELHDGVVGGRRLGILVRVAVVGDQATAQLTKDFEREHPDEDMSSGAPLVADEDGPKL